MLSSVFLILLRLRRRNPWLVFVVALGALVVGVQPARPLFWLVAAVPLFGVLAAAEPVLVVLVAAEVGVTWTLNTPWVFFCATAVGAAAAGVALQRWRGADEKPVAALGTLLLIATLVVAVLHTPWVLGAVFSALVLAPFGMDILLPRRRGGAPRVWHLLGGFYVFFYALFLQLFLLLVAGRLLRWSPARMRGAGNVGIGGLIRSFPYGRRDFFRIDAQTFAKPAIVVSNHQSSLDIILVLGLPGDVRLTTSPRVWDEPWLGHSARKLGHLRVDEDLLENCRRVVAEGASVHFFPEGTRSHDGYPARFRRGAFELAVQLGIDVLPVVFTDTREAVPRDAYWVENFELSVKALDRIEPGNDSRALQKRVQELVREEYEKELARMRTPDSVRRKVKRLYRYMGWRALFGVRRELERPPENVLELKDCGYGAAAHVLSEVHPRLKIRASDPDKKKIAIARRSAEFKPRLTFSVEHSVEDSVEH